MADDAIKIVIPSFNRSKTIKTHRMLDEAGYQNYFILVHSQEQADEYISNPTVNPERIIVTGEPRGITNQRRWIVKNLISRGEWYISMDDNVGGFVGVHPDHYDRSVLPVTSAHFDKSIFDYRMTFNDFLIRAMTDITYCEGNGICYGGFATVPNYYFLGKKYRKVGYVISKVAIIKSMGIEYDANLEAMEDFGFTAENLLTFGRVLINNFIIPIAGHYEPGGIGTYEERVPRKIRDCAYLMAKYPGLFRYKVKSGCHPKAEIQIKFTSVKQIEAWRLKLGMLSVG